MVAFGVIEPSPPVPDEPKPHALRGSLGAALGAVAVAVVLLFEPIRTFDSGLWGPENCWHNRDFLGAWWLFWDASTHSNGLALQNWPDGALALQHHIPNPFDGWLLGPLVWDSAFPRWWNVMQLSHHLLNVAASAVLARMAGARTGGALAAGALVAASPIMLHEVAGGRTLSGVVWPGLLALSAQLRGRSVVAGLLLGIQGLCYLYTGLLFGALALILRPAWGLLSAAIPLGVYGSWLWPLVAGLHGKPPPAGFTQLPIAGLIGSEVVPERFRLHPVLLAGIPGLGLSLLSASSERASSLRWLLAISLSMVVALGPAPEWSSDGALFTSPLALLVDGVPGLGRMHHPIRAALVLVPLMAVGVALFLRRVPARLGAIPVVLAFLSAEQVERAVSWGVDPVPPGRSAVAYLQDAPEGAVVDLTGEGGSALGLQPLHGRAMLEGLRKPRSPARGGTRMAPRLRKRVDGWLRGERVPGLADELLQTGFAYVLVVNRTNVEIDLGALEADLGPPVAPGVYALSRSESGQ